MAKVVHGPSSLVGAPIVRRATPQEKSNLQQYDKSRGLGPKVFNTSMRRFAESDVFSKAIALMRDEMAFAQNRKDENEEIELEVRLGVQGGSSGTQDSYWSNAYEYCKKLPGVTKYYSHILDEKLMMQGESKISTWSNQGNGVVFRKRTFKGRSGAWQAKKRINVMDVPEHWARISLSSEALMHEPPDIINLSQRWISRHTFVYKNARIDFSKTNTDGELANEIEVEYILGVPNTTVQTFTNICKDIIREMFASPLPFTLSELKVASQITNTYLDPQNQSRRNFLDRNYFSQARNLGVGELNFDRLFKQIIKIAGKDKVESKEWYASRKVDGERAIFVTCDAGSWFLFPPAKSQLLSFGPEHRGAAMSIFDCEVYNQTDFFFLHTLFINGTDYRGKYFGEGIDAAKYWRNETKLIPQGMRFLFKDFMAVNNSNFFEQVEHLREMSRRPPIAFGGENIYFQDDGIILTPATVDYFGLVENTQILKWKPVVTVDLRIKIEKGILKLYSSDIRERDGLKMFEDVPFYGSTTKKFNGAIDMADIFYNSGSVIEFKWDLDRKMLVAIRNRNDKTGANRTSVAEDNWKRMAQESLILDEATLLSKNNILVKKSHNRIKKTLINNIVVGRKGLRLLDIGSGRGPDLDKWVVGEGKNKRALFDHIFCIEPSEVNISGEGGLKERLAGYDVLKDRVHILQAYGQETDKIWNFIKSFIGNSQVDVVAMMDSLTFFFDPSNKDLLQLKKTVDTCLRPGGNFIWKMIDGDRVKAAFGTQNGDTLKYGQDTIIQRLNENQIKVSILPWIENQTEYLSSVQRLRDILNLEGIEKPAINETLLTKEYGDFSNLYSYGNFTLGSDVSNLPVELKRAYNASTPLQPPYRNANTALEALESIFTLIPRNQIIENYIALAQSIDIHQKAPRGTPDITYFQSAFMGHLVYEFLLGKSLETLMGAKADNAISVSIADMLGIDLFIVNEDKEYILSNAIEGRERFAIVIMFNNGKYSPVIFKKSVIVPYDSPFLESYHHSKPKTFLDTFVNTTRELPLNKILKEIGQDSTITYDISGGVYERLLYVDVGLNKTTYLSILSIVLKSQKVKDTTEKDLAYYKTYFPLAKIAAALEFVNQMLEIVQAK